MTNQQELKPCPVCLSSAEILPVEFAISPGNAVTETFYYVNCSNDRCGLRTKEWFPKSSAIRKWDDRTQQPVTTSDRLFWVTDKYGKRIAAFISCTDAEAYIAKINELGNYEWLKLSSPQTGAAEGMPWQPISSAPKDRRILVQTDQEIYAAHWVKHPATDDEAWLVARLDDEGNQALVRPHSWTELRLPKQSMNGGSDD